MCLSPILALLVALAQPPAIPDFTGHWKMVPDRSGSPAQSEPVTDMTFAIAQTGDSIRLDMSSSSKPPVSATYVIGPAPKQPADPLGPGQQRAYWDGNRLVVERGGTISGQTVSSKQSLTLSPDRSELIVERLVIVQHGYTLKGTNNYATVRDVFVRVTK
jgi:hypothetical protein